MNKNSHHDHAFVVGIHDGIITCQTQAVVGLYEQVNVPLEDGERKKAIRKIRGEIIRVSGHEFWARMFEDCKDIKVGQSIELTHMPIMLNPNSSMLGQVLDAFLTPYEILLNSHGPYVKRGTLPINTNEAIQTPLRTTERHVPNYAVSNVFFLRNAIVDALYPLVEGGSLCVTGSKHRLRQAINTMLEQQPTIDVFVFALCGVSTKEAMAFIEYLKQTSHDGAQTSLFDSSIVIVSTASMASSMQDLSVLSAIKAAEYFQNLGQRVLLMVDDLSHWMNTFATDNSCLETRLAHFFSRAGIKNLAPNMSHESGSLTILTTCESMSDEVFTLVSPHVGCVLSFDDQGRLDPRISRSIYDTTRLITQDAQEALAHNKTAEAIKRILIHGAELEQLVSLMPEDDLSMEDYQSLLQARLVHNLVTNNKFYGSMSSLALARVVKLLAIIINHQFQALSKHDVAAVFSTASDLIEKVLGSEKEPDFLVTQTKLSSMLTHGAKSFGVFT